MREKLLSVIIPTYNMETLLRRCLESLLVDEDNRALLEVLIINDGSQDSSSAIGHEYASLYPQTFRVIDKENGNYGSCVNRGLQEMTGKYVRILDADDYYQTEDLDRFISLLKDTDVDLVLTDMVSVYADGSRIRHGFSFDETIVYDSSLMAQDGFKDEMEMHCVTYKKDVLDRLCYRQTEGISYTDQEWIFYPMASVQTISYFPLVIYTYMLDRAGQTMDMDVEVRHVRHKMMIARRMMDSLRMAPYDQCKNETYLKYRLWKFVRLIYKLVLLYQTDEQYRAYSGELDALDEKVRHDLPELYEAMNAMVISSAFPLKFIRHWREKHCRYPQVLLLLHKQLKHLDVFLRKIHLRGS